MDTIGDAYHVHGPLVVAPEAVAAQVVTSFAKAKAPLAAIRRAEQTALVGPRLATLFGERVLLLPSGTPTRVLPFEGGVVLVRSLRPLRSLKPASYPATEHLGPFSVDEPLVLFDSVAGADLDWRGSADLRQRYLKLRAARLLPLPLEPGPHEVFFSPPAPLSAGPQVVRIVRADLAAARPSHRRR